MIVVLDSVVVSKIQMIEEIRVVVVIEPLVWPLYPNVDVDSGN
jgi:hypothetical protein